mmetsp:Transcript_32765/g.72377  ORF Transcript_32765/g.72377 Transcript_32765/m.72377 type:complete len:248 (+) Transcript_32765:101-844(+)|eukprot:CAMPEP_0202891302 /NCGR_PEP_ID=MMETSP1392-20130828/1396_1 /ASSEMBLY_ACC=CAM_ASM_000868 /TAXON_ID=225041 /ORGANISM="Chlamydomonas chlamydogama, Strain SAG 11-48b" /LENGTH=247 /DNA_ID=CAMNT_0049575011 /DNA_START=100 /DNA_END=843 /DNA_ORIENTATION=+
MMRCHGHSLTGLRKNVLAKRPAPATLPARHNSVNRPHLVSHQPAAPRDTRAATALNEKTHSTTALHRDIGKVLFSEQQLEVCLTRLGSQIGDDYRGKHVLVLGVLKGGFMFTADLVRHIQPVPPMMEVDFIKASSYGSGTETSGFVKLDDGFDVATLKGKHVLVVEDIVDSGLTLTKIVAMLRASGTASVKVATLLDKRARRKVVFEADYVGFDCPDEFVVGYGIDYNERFRFLPYVGVPKPEAVSS